MREHFPPSATPQLRRLIHMALEEDGPDLTSEAVFQSKDRLSAIIVAKKPTVVAGLPLVPLVFEVLGTPCAVENKVHEGTPVAEGAVLCSLEGSARAILKAERIILNFLQHLCGVATLTRAFVDAVAGTGVRILDTRKTTPGMRFLEKYAVRMGGGTNHRLGLADMLMLKDNHIDRAGSITAAVAAIRAAYGHQLPLEIECRTLAHVEEALVLRPDRIMLDNMDLPTLRQALHRIAGQVETEVSGNITLATVRSVAELRPTYISVGALTHSAPAADLSLRILPLEDLP